MNQITLDELKKMAEDARGSITHVYMHWTAGHYGSFFDHYHISIDNDGSVYVSTDDLTELKAHTWHRNTGAVGVTLNCCVGATSNDLGSEPPTPEQIESLARVVAILSDGMGVPNTPEYIMTHAEAADLDDYGPATTCERWDLAILANGDEWMSGGNVIRGKAEYYRVNGLDA